MRKLITRDIFACARCIERTGIKDVVRNIAEKSNGSEDLFNRGFDFFWDVLQCAARNEAEEEVYKFLSGPFEMTTEEVGDLSIEALADNLKKMARENDLLAFFKSAVDVKR